MFFRKCKKCTEMQKHLERLLEENYSLKIENTDKSVLEKEIAYWKEKALNFKKFHI